MRDQVNRHVPASGADARERAGESGAVLAQGRPLHGGRLADLSREYRIPRAQWLDLSTGVCPRPYPVRGIPDEVWQHLPDEDKVFDRVLQDYYACDSVLAIPGSSWAIENLPEVFRDSGEAKNKQVCLPAKAYAEHAYHWRRAGFDLSFYAHLPSRDQLESSAACVLINPNNPVGSRYPREDVLRCHELIHRAGGSLIVDEAFIECFPEHSVTPFCPTEGLLVLRSVGKFFGLAGIRLGAIAAVPRLLSKLHERLSPWAITGPTREVAKQALRDKAWHSMNFAWLCSASQRLEGLLIRNLGLAVSNAVLFATVSLDDAEYCYEVLCMRGIAVRLLDDKSGLRFGLPGDENEWSRFEAALQELRPKVFPAPCSSGVLV